MEFEDFPFEACDFKDPADFEAGQSFPAHFEVLSYLRRFAEPIRHLIQVYFIIIKPYNQWFMYK